MSNRTWDETREFMECLPPILLSYAASVRDSDNNQSPLQIITNSNRRAPIDVFRVLVSANPQEVAFQTPVRGSSPMHNLVRHSYVEAIAELAKANPGAHLLRDCDGRIPFDVAKNDEVRSHIAEHFLRYGLAGELLMSHSYESQKVCVFLGAFSHHQTSSLKHFALFLMNCRC